MRRSRCCALAAALARLATGQACAEGGPIAPIGCGEAQGSLARAVSCAGWQAILCLPTAVWCHVQCTMCTMRTCNFLGKRLIRPLCNWALLCNGGAEKQAVSIRHIVTMAVVQPPPLSALAEAPLSPLGVDSKPATSGRELWKSAPCVVLITRRPGCSECLALLLWFRISMRPRS